MPPRRKRNLNLAPMFQAAASSLDKHRSELNQADSYNHNHGDNMVEIFSAISEALEEKKGRRPATQLAHASKVLEQRSQSGSAKVYANGLAQASQQFKGQRSISPEDLSSLLGTLMGGQGGSGGTSAGGAADLLGTLVSGLAGGQGAASQPSQDAAGLMSTLLGGTAGGPATSQPSGGAGDLLGSLLGSLGSGSQGGTSQAASGQDGLDLGDLLNAGMAFMGSQQQGDSAMQSIIKAFVAATQAGQSPHRAQSGELVVNSMMQELAKRSSR